MASPNITNCPRCNVNAAEEGDWAAEPDEWECVNCGFYILEDICFEYQFTLGSTYYIVVEVQEHISIIYTPGFVEYIGTLNIVLPPTFNDVEQIEKLLLLT